MVYIVLFAMISINRKLKV